MNKYNNDEINILNEKSNFSLSLRKKKLNKKILENRLKYINKEFAKLNNNNKVAYLTNEEKDNTISNDIKSKFNKLMLDKNINEKNYLKYLEELFEYISKNFIKIIELKKINEPLIESILLEKIVDNLIIEQKINNKEILNLILIIFSCIIFIYNHLHSGEIYKNIFISNEKYIELYLSLFNIKDEEVIYNSLKFIGLLSHGSKEIMEKLFNGKLLEIIVNNNLYDYEIEIIEIKLWCISQFEMKKIFFENKELCLKMQKLYIFIFNNFLIKNNDFNDGDEFLINYLKLITNLSYCIDEEYIQNLLKTNIINFLLDSNINKNLSKENILTIIGNMNSISNQKISLNLYQISIQFLLNIILDKENNDDIKGLSLWCINNFSDYKIICLDIYFNKNFLTINKNYIIKSKIIDENIFYEICFGYHNLIRNINEENKILIVKEYNIISLIIQGFKKIEKFENINKLGNCVIELIFSLLTIDNEELVNFCRYIFEIEGGNEYIFEKINLLLLEQKNINDTKEISELNESEYNILKFIHFIKTHLLDFEYN